MKKITNTNKKGFYFEVIGNGVYEYRRDIFNKLTCITYHHHKKEKVEKVALKKFPYYTICGCDECGYTAYYRI